MQLLKQLWTLRPFATPPDAPTLVHPYFTPLNYSFHQNSEAGNLFNDDNIKAGEEEKKQQRKL